MHQWGGMCELSAFQNWNNSLLPSSKMRHKKYIETTVWLQWMTLRMLGKWAAAVQNFLISHSVGSIQRVKNTFRLGSPFWDPNIAGILIAPSIETSSAMFALKTFQRVFTWLCSFLHVGFFISICNKWSRNSREICTVNKIACYLLHGIVLYIFFLLYFFLLACIFGKVSKGGVGSNKEENMTQSGTIHYVQGLGKNRPHSSDYLSTKQNWKILCVLALVYWWSSDCKLYDVKIAQIIEVQLYLLKALTVEFRRQCQRKFDAAMLNVATNKKQSCFFPVFTCPFKHLFWKTFSLNSDQ